MNNARQRPPLGGSPRSKRHGADGGYFLLPFWWLLGRRDQGQRRPVPSPPLWFSDFP